MDETKYSVTSEYKVEDHASAAFERIAKVTERLGHGVTHLTHKFNEFRMEQRFVAAAMFGVGFGLGSWIEKAKEANSQFYTVRRNVAGMLTELLEWPKGVDGVARYNRAMALANEHTEELEETSIRFATPLTEVSAGYKAIAAAVAPLHLSQKQVMDLTKQTAAAAKVAGMDMSQASELVGRAVMMHQVRPVGMLGKELHNALSAQGKLRSKMTGTQTLAVVQKVLKDQMPVAEAMTNQIGDNFFRIQVLVEKIFRRLTGPVFAEVTKQIGEWAHYLDHADKGSKSILDTWSVKLLDAFHTMKDITVFIAEHWKLIAASWAAMKVGGGLTSVGGRLGGMKGWGPQVLGTAFGQLGASIGPVVVGLTALKMAIDVITDAYLKKTDAQDKAKSEAQAAIRASDTFGKYQSRMTAFGPMEQSVGAAVKTNIKELVGAGLLTSGGLSRAAIASRIGEMDWSDRAMLSGQLGLRKAGTLHGAASPEELADRIVARIQPVLEAHPELLPGFKAAAAVAQGKDDDKLKFKGKVIAQFTGPITLNQKFDDVDPDRVWIATKRGIEESAERRVSSAYASSFTE